MQKQEGMSRRDFLRISLIGGTATVAGLLHADTIARVAADEQPTADFWDKSYKVKSGKKTPTICPYCACGCGIVVTSLGDKIIDIEGDPDHPINEGALCSKGNAYFQLITTDRRIMYPMKRTNPLKGETQDPGWQRITWSEAFDTIKQKVADAYADVELKRDEGGYTNYYRIGIDSPIAWHGSSYFNNEECYLSKKLMSLLGSMNTEHQARKCHASTVAALGSTFGFGAMTNHFIDMKNTKRVIIMGSNAAEQHPIAFKWVQKARENGAKIMSLDPRYTRSSSKSDIYTPFRSGTDAAIFLGMMRYLFYEKPGRIDETFLDARTNAPYTVDGTYVGLSDANSNFQTLKGLVADYTLEEVEKISGAPRAKLEAIYDMFTEEKPGTILYSMGTTQHTNATHMIRSYAVTQLLLGNVGKPGGGINALRGISNVQGSTDMNILSHYIMGYRGVPRSVDDVRRYQKWKNTDPGTRGGISGGITYVPSNKTEQQWDARMFPTWNALEYYWGMFVGTYPGDNPDLEPVISDLPIGNGNATVQWFRAMNDGLTKVAFIVGENNAVSNANSTLVKQALAKCPFTVVYEIFDHETAHFADILLPATVPVEREGSITNSGRWVQWRWKAREPPEECKPELEFLTELLRAIREEDVKMPSELYKADTGNDLGSDLDGCWPSPFGDNVVAVYREMGEMVNPTVRAGTNPLTGAAYVTAQPCTNILHKKSYDYNGYPDLGGVLAKRRSKEPASPQDKEYGFFKNWAWTWMYNQRILYNIDEDPEGLKTFFCWWATSDTVFLGLDKASVWSKVRYSPSTVTQLIADGKFSGTADQHPLTHGFPLHNEPTESPLSDIANKYPTLWDDRYEVDKGTVADYPCVLTTFRLTEHMQAGAMTRNLPWLVELHPEMFVEISREYASTLGVKSGDTVKVTTARSSITVKALVTDRLKPFTFNGSTLHLVAMPWHWGFKGLSTGASANDITIDAVDIHANIPETKACLCKVEKG